MLSKEASCAGTPERAKADLKIPGVSTTYASGCWRDWEKQYGLVVEQENSLGF